MGRDLLYRPQPVIAPDEESEGGVKKTGQDKNSNKAATIAKARGPRDLGHVGASVMQKLSQANAGGGPKAHKHAYFNNDTSGVGRANLGTRNARSLRGSNEATDLRKIVLPQSVAGVEHPEPTVLQGAMDLMGVGADFNTDLTSLIGRQGAWAKSKGMTPERLKERMAQLEEMIEARKAALGKMAEGKSQLPITSKTLLHAAKAGSEGLGELTDLASAGTELIQETASQADGLHARLAKMFGVKLQ